MKKFLGLALAVVIAFSTSAVFAAEANKEIVVNSKKIEARYITADDGVVMLPLRAVCEELGFEVNWFGESRSIELAKGDIVIACSPDFDQYTFPKMPNHSLGKKPILVEGRTYVPESFITNILGGRVYQQDNSYTIFVSENVTLPAIHSTASVYATEMNEKSLTVMDFLRGEVILAVTDDTEIFDFEGKKIEISDIDTSKQLEVIYGAVMTLSIPAHTNAVRITVTNKLANVIKEGAVTEILKDKEGNVTQIILGENEVVLNVSAETVVKDAEGNIKTLEDIAIGSTLKARTSGIMTKSIPAQMPAIEIMFF